MNRINVYGETMKASRDLPVPPTEKWNATMLGGVFRPLAPASVHRTKISVKNQDCIDLALELKANGYNPVVLNLSDDYAAGGAVLMGSGAQEESLWRRTALCHTQTQRFYPLCCVGEPADLLYSPGVPVLREAESNGYRWKIAPYPTMDFIACPALKYPKLSKEGGLKPEDRALLAERLELILRVAAHKGHDVVVLGAMGCGAWRSPPRDVADLFAEILPRFDGYFKQIPVAILTTADSRSGPSLAEIFTERLAGILSI